MTDFRFDLRRGALITAALALLCSVFLVLPASAEAEPFDDCPPATFCLYSGADGTGERRDFTDRQNAESYDATWDGKALSAKNNTAMWACVYGDPAYGGHLETVDLDAEDAYAAGAVSGHKLVPTRALCFTGYERCPDNRVCTFAERNGRGAMTVHLPATDPATRNYGNSYGTGPAPKSAWNRTAKDVCFYPQPTYTGTWADPADTTGVKKFGAYVVLRGDSVTVPAPFAGTFRSHELVTTTGDCQ
ncbi:peptidase inhibitor family I36 protein [Streptomyces sp. NBC_01255]|uniref:peptidase inhibitor family I36 protein n=1 Tax=Streptomyces sp. NBC_01255 TaxID=2903798 RepID=UPI002E31F475|nr:peptidase inhibitor family I36 protein [Streptomyces sp. NBC_01255]